MKKLLVVVEESPNVLLILKEVLSLDFEVEQARSSFELFNILKTKRPTMILTNSRFKTGSAFEMLTLLRRSGDWYANIPVIIVSSEINAETIKSAQKARALEVIKRPFEPLSLLARLNGIFERLEKLSELQQKAQEAQDAKDDKNRSVDPVTGLQKRRFTQDSIEERIRKSGKGGMLLVDLDNFSYVCNNVSEDAMKAAAETLENSLTKNAIISVSGKSSFVIYIEGLSERKEIQDVADAVIKKLLSISLKEQLFVSIGLAAAPKHGTTYDELYAQCDRGLGFARQCGKNAATFYNW